jgi:energy-coupling factor transporter ATP-binding protein EcfA2
VRPSGGPTQSLELRRSDRTQPGTSLGIVGRTGSGKSSIGRLALRLWDPEVGKVRLGGKDLRALVDEAKAKIGSGVVVFVGVEGGKAGVAIGVTKELTAKYSAVDLVKAAAAAIGGQGGGGRPDMAQAGGPDADNVEAAIEAVRALLKG